jgi:putative N6-adenine-specific DNA methylase
MEYFIAKTFAGLENELFKELHALGAKNCEKLSRAVAFEGDLAMMYRANYFCRTALRILWRRKQFTFKSNRQFYEQIFDFPAEEYLSPDGTLAVHATIVDTIFSTPLYASVLAKDAICDRFRDQFERRPSVDK